MQNDRSRRRRRFVPFPTHRRPWDDYYKPTHAPVITDPAMFDIEALRHVSQFTLTQPGFDLIVANTGRGHVAWREFNGHRDPESYKGRYLKRDGTYGWVGIDGATEADFLFDTIESALIAAGDTFVTLTPEQVEQLQKEPEPCQT